MLGGGINGMLMQLAGGNERSRADYREGAAARACSSLEYRRRRALVKIITASHLVIRHVSMVGSTTKCPSGEAN